MPLVSAIKQEQPSFTTTPQGKVCIFLIYIYICIFKKIKLNEMGKFKLGIYRSASTSVLELIIKVLRL